MKRSSNLDYFGNHGRNPIAILHADNAATAARRRSVCRNPVLYGCKRDSQFHYYERRLSIHGY